MPSVEVDETIRAPIREVWALICNAEAYKQMDPIESLEVVEEGPNWAIWRWEVKLKGSILIWTQRDTRREEDFRLEFHQLDGDLETFQGFWQLESLGDRQTRAILSVQFEIGIPMLSEMLDPVAVRAIRNNSHSMLSSLVQQTDFSPSSGQ